MNKKYLVIILLVLIVISGVLIFRLSSPALFSFSKPVIKEVEPMPEPTKIASFIAVGDISYSRSIERAYKKADDMNYPFALIGQYLQQADFVFGNLETPITAGREIQSGEMIFRSNPGLEQVLKNNNFAIVSLANNHTPNFGDKGLEDTFSYLEKAGIKYVGAGNNELLARQPVYITSNGFKFAFLAYNDSDVVPSSYEASAEPGTAFMNINHLAEDISLAKKESDFVVVSMHSGTEYVPKPNSRQIEFAHAAIDAGADLVIGHHPHVVQTLEEYQGKYIFYSLGNFIFDQRLSDETEQGLLAKFRFNQAGLEGVELLPVYNNSLGRPEPANETKSNTILKRLSFPISGIFSLMKTDIDL
jgi:poly-gamma-glutamate synthesis protein (capsule biosynthesis protein)